MRLTVFILGILICSTAFAETHKCVRFELRTTNNTAFNRVRNAISSEFDGASKFSDGIGKNSFSFGTDEEAGVNWNVISGSIVFLSESDAQSAWARIKAVNLSNVRGKLMFYDLEVEGTPAVNKNMETVTL